MLSLKNALSREEKSKSLQRVKLKTNSYIFKPSLSQQIIIRHVSVLNKNFSNCGFKSVKLLASPLTPLKKRKPYKLSLISAKNNSKILQDNNPEKFENKENELKINSKKATLETPRNLELIQLENSVKLNLPCVYNTSLRNPLLPDSKSYLHENILETLLGTQGNSAAKLNLDSIKSVFAQTFIEHDKNRCKKPKKEMSDISHLNPKDNLNRKKTLKLKNPKVRELIPKEPIVFLELVANQKLTTFENRQRNLNSLTQIEVKMNLEERMKNQFLFPRISSNRFNSLISKVSNFLDRVIPSHDAPPDPSKVFITQQFSQLDVLHKLQNLGKQAILSYNSLEQFRKLSDLKLDFIEKQVQEIAQGFMNSSTSEVSSASQFFAGHIKTLKLFHDFSAYSLKLVHDEVASSDIGYGNCVLNSAFLNYFVCEYSILLFEELLTQLNQFNIAAIFSQNRSILKQRDELLVNERSKDLSLAIIKDKYKNLKSQNMTLKTEVLKFEQKFHDTNTELLKYKGLLCLQKHQSAVFENLLKEIINTHFEKQAQFPTDPNCLNVAKMSSIILMQRLYEDVLNKFTDGAITLDQAIQRLTEIVAQSRFYELTTLQESQKADLLMDEVREFEGLTKQSIIKSNKRMNDEHKSSFLNKVVRIRSFRNAEQVGLMIQQHSQAKLGYMKQYSQGYGSSAHVSSFVSKEGRDIDFRRCDPDNQKEAQIGSDISAKQLQPTIYNPSCSGTGHLNDWLYLRESGVQTDNLLGQEIPSGEIKVNILVMDSVIYSEQFSDDKSDPDNNQHQCKEKGRKVVIKFFERLDYQDFLNEELCFDVLDKLDDCLKNESGKTCSDNSENNTDTLKRVTAFYKTQKRYNKKFKGKIGHLFRFIFFKLKKLSEKIGIESNSLKSQFSEVRKSYGDSENDSRKNLSGKNESLKSSDNSQLSKSESIYNFSRVEISSNFKDSENLKNESQLPEMSRKSKEAIKTKIKITLSESKKRSTAEINPFPILRTNTPSKLIQQTSLMPNSNKNKAMFLKTVNESLSLNKTAGNLTVKETGLNIKLPDSAQKNSQSSFLGVKQSFDSTNQKSSHRFSFLPDVSLLNNIKDSVNETKSNVKVLRETNIRKNKYEKEAFQIFQTITGPENENQTRLISRCPILPEKTVIKTIHSIYEFVLSLKGVNELNIANLTIEFLSRNYSLEPQLYKKYTHLLVNVRRLTPENSSINLFGMFLGLNKYLDERSFRIYLDIIVLLKDLKIDIVKENFKIESRVFIDIIHQIIPQEINLYEKIEAEIEQLVFKKNGKILVDIDLILVKILPRICTILGNMNDLFFRIADEHKNGIIQWGIFDHLLKAFEPQLTKSQREEIHLIFSNLRNNNEGLDNEAFKQIVTQFNILDDKTRVRVELESRCNGVIRSVSELLTDWPTVKNLFLEIAEANQERDLILQIQRFDKHIYSYDGSYENVLWIGFKFIEIRMNDVLTNERIRFTTLTDELALIADFFGQL